MARNRTALPAVLMLGAVVGFTVPAAAAADEEEPSDDEAVTYEQHIAPLMPRHCTDCHGWLLPKGGFRSDSRERLIQGGRTGPGVVPGEPDKGWLMHTITLAGGRYKMPPDPVSLPPEDIATIREWIRQGAP
jgi:mono/diheme cytochrome c family protein